MNSLKIFLLSLVLSLPALAADFQEGDLESALQKAKATGKIVLVDVYAIWCNPCTVLEKQVLSTPEVSAWIDENTVPVRIDGERGEGPDFVEKYKLFAYPTVFFLQPDGTELGHIVGAPEKEDWWFRAQHIARGEDPLQALEAQLLPGPGKTELRLRLAEGLIDDQRFHEALPHLELLVKSDAPEAGQAAFLLDAKAKSFLRTIEERTEELLDQAENGGLLPEQVPTLAMMLATQKDKKDLLFQFERQTRSLELPWKERAKLARTVAKLYQADKNYQAANAAIEAALKAIESQPLPEDSGAGERFLYQLARTSLRGYLVENLLREDQVEAAHQVAQESVNLDSSTGNLNRLAWAAFEAEKSDTFFLELAKKGNEQAQSKDLNMADTLANVLHQLGHTDEAVQVLDAAIETTNSSRRIQGLKATRDEMQAEAAPAFATDSL